MTDYQTFLQSKALTVYSVDIGRARLEWWSRQMSFNFDIDLHGGMIT